MDGAAVCRADATRRLDPRTSRGGGVPRGVVTIVWGHETRAHVPVRARRGLRPAAARGHKKMHRACERSGVVLRAGSIDHCFLSHEFVFITFA